jgi:protein ImuB
MVVCALIPRFALVAALRARRELLGEPVALGPEPGGVASVGEVSPAAEAFGVITGMRVGEALARCPSLQLVPPDPEAVSWLWGDALDRLEGIGAAVESDRPGEGYFEADGLLGLHDGRIEAVMAAARRALAQGGLAGVRMGASTWSGAVGSLCQQ